MDPREQILAAAEDLFEASDFEVVDVECIGAARGFTVRVYIDREKGLSLEDCARVSRALGDQLEADNAMPGKYILEVSSPGMDRPLRKDSDFEKFAGEKVQILTFEKIGGRLKHIGQLKGINLETNHVLLSDDEGGTIEIPRGSIKKANLKRNPWDGVKPEARKSKSRRRKKR